MSVSSFLAKAGWKVTVLEKHEMPGGRGRVFSENGFTFDMGPSWYWMPDVFERYFNSFGKKTADFYNLIRLDPSYTVYYPDGPTPIPANYEALRNLFESIEKGSALQLDCFMQEAAYKYEVGINKLVHKPGRSLSEFVDLDLAKGLLKLDVFTSMKKHVGKHFKHPKLVQLMEFPVLFLGALASDIPALYSLMNYADIKLGTWYPEGGMGQIGKAMHQLAVGLGVEFQFLSDVKKINIQNKSARSVTFTKDNVEHTLEADVVVGSADYHFIESQLLPSDFQSYDKKYWDKRVMAPSCLLYYIGLDKKIEQIAHHSLFFDVDFDQHGKEIYSNPQWPT